MTTAPGVPDLDPLTDKSPKIVLRPKAGSSQTDEGAGAGEREAEAFGSGAVSGEANPEGRSRGESFKP